MNKSSKGLVLAIHTDSQSRKSLLCQFVNFVNFIYLVNSQGGKVDSTPSIGAPAARPYLRLP